MQIKANVFKYFVLCIHSIWFGLEFWWIAILNARKLLCVNGGRLKLWCHLWTPADDEFGFFVLFTCLSVLILRSVSAFWSSLFEWIWPSVAFSFGKFPKTLWKNNKHEKRNWSRKGIEMNMFAERKKFNWHASVCAKLLTARRPARLPAWLAVLFGFLFAWKQHINTISCIQIYLFVYYCCCCRWFVFICFACST